MGQRAIGGEGSGVDISITLQYLMIITFWTRRDSVPLDRWFGGRIGGSGLLQRGAAAGPLGGPGCLQTAVRVHGVLLCRCVACRNGGVCIFLGRKTGSAVLKAPGWCGVVEAGRIVGL